MNDRPFEPLHAAYHAPLDGISERIAADDVMFQGREKHYRNVGQSAWRCLTAAMLTAGVDTPRRILDLPCGHGRVLRVLKRAFPEAALTACDLDQSGVDFCAEEFAATPVYSHQDMAQVQFDEPFDLIWCGSLVTHLDQQGWLQTFQLFLRSLQPNGLAVITFHGRWVAYLMQQGRNYQLSDDSRQRVLADYARTGFGYADYGRPKRLRHLAVAAELGLARTQRVAPTAGRLAVRAAVGRTPRRDRGAASPRRGLTTRDAR